MQRLQTPPPKLLTAALTVLFYKCRYSHCLNAEDTKIKTGSFFLSFHSFMLLLYLLNVFITVENIYFSGWHQFTGLESKIN